MPRLLPYGANGRRCAVGGRSGRVHDGWWRINQHGNAKGVGGGWNAHSAVWIGADREGVVLQNTPQPPLLLFPNIGCFAGPMSTTPPWFFAGSGGASPRVIFPVRIMSMRLRTPLRIET